VVCSFSSTVTRICVVALQRAQLFFQGGAHLGDALFVALGQFLQAQAEAFGQALLRLRAFLAALARIVHQGLAQRAQLAVGAGGQFLQLLAEGMDARLLLLAEHFQLRAQFLQALAHQRTAALLAFGRFSTRLACIFAKRFAQQVQALVGAGGQIGQRAGEAIELFAQFAAAGTRLLAHGLFQAVMGRAAQQGDQLQDEDGQEEGAEEQEFGLHAASVGWPRLKRCVWPCSNCTESQPRSMCARCCGCAPGWTWRCGTMRHPTPSCCAG